MTDIGRNIWAATRIFFARLRFVAVFVVAALVIGYWDNIKNHYDKWTRPPIAPDLLGRASVSNIEYYCPMHPDVIREEAGQCPKCGMPLVKRKKGEAQQLPADVLARVNLTPRRMALAGIGTSAVESKELLREIRSVGVLDYDETRIAQISARVPGRADELSVQYTGQSVKKGDPLYSLYSPEVFTSLRQYLMSRKRVNELPKDAPEDAKMDASTDYNATMQKLVLWGVSHEQLDLFDDEYDRTGKIPTNLTVTSPINGIVVKKDINPGQYLQVGETPYTVADLSRLWLQLKLYERDIPLVQIGDAVEIVVEAFPNDTFMGTITFKAFQLDPETRTLDARVEVDNPSLRLSPGMFADAVVRVPVGAPTSRPSTGPSMSPATMQVHEIAPQLSPAKMSELYRDGLQPYLHAQTLLARDKSEGVAASLQQSVAKLAPLASIDSMKDSYDRFVAAVKPTKDQPLAELRTSFKDISAALIEIGKTVGIPAQGPGVRVFRCPMKKANWLQEGDATANPYYGAEMFNCGSAVESLPRTNPNAPPTQLSSAGGRKGKALAVPRSAVIDTGKNKIVYVESSPGVFDMHAVKLGPPAIVPGKPGQLAEEFYPVVEGLDEGDRVVTVGTFLVDAENRLNPSKMADTASGEKPTPQTPSAGRREGM
jgi:multidrug efflux pump subunit AcrA (membrane-fusion protein)